jgi:Flp pilus assembly pilin Flp
MAHASATSFAEGPNVLARIHFAKCLAKDHRAVTALEYGIIAGVLGLELIAIFHSFGSSLSTLFKGIGSSI